MQQSGPRQDVTIGILGTSSGYNVRNIFLIVLPALQGAFAEHQVMFQKVSIKKKVVIVLVRTPEDLDKCDALVIPGGGTHSRLYETYRLPTPIV